MSLKSRNPSAAPSDLADVASEPLSGSRWHLAQVGMEGVQTVLHWAEGGRAADALRLAARAAVRVDLPGGGARGIHMSRLYRALDTLGSSELTPASVAGMLRGLLQTHAGLSHCAGLCLDFDLPVRRQSLQSGLSGWRLYPVRIDAELDADGLHIDLGVDVLYSSTCPGSAAMARQRVQAAFVERFPAPSVDTEAAREWLGGTEGVPATPHAQRSLARVLIRWNQVPGEFGTEPLLDAIEGALATPVQAAVRREDEQAFAALNARNPMYCEDAARRLVTVLESRRDLSDWALRVAHLESLHPHDAVAVAVRGVRGGLRPADLIRAGA